MIRPANRRFVNSSIAVLIGVALLLVYSATSTALADPSVLFGWILLAIVFVLSIFNLRKKLTNLPLGRSAYWLQAHVYLGVLSILVFMLHINWRIPKGPLEIILAIVFAGLAVSGIVGLYVTRVFPSRLRVYGGEAIFERIPFHLRSLRDSADALALESASTTGFATTSFFYNDVIRPFLYDRVHIWRQLSNNQSSLTKLIRETDYKKLYVNEVEQEYLSRMVVLAEEKARLDHQFALQFVLKAWLFVHIPLTYGLWVLVIAHIVLVHQFSGIAL